MLQPVQGGHRLPTSASGVARPHESWHNEKTSDPLQFLAHRPGGLRLSSFCYAEELVIGMASVGDSSYLRVELGYRAVMSAAWLSGSWTGLLPCRAHQPRLCIRRQRRGVCRQDDHSLQWCCGHGKCMRCVAFWSAGLSSDQPRRSGGFGPCRLREVA